jgi:hypothetical protein
MINVTLSAKKQDHLVKYHSFQHIKLSDSPIGISNVNFHIPTLIEEVKLLPKKERKSIKKEILTFQVTLASFMMFPLTSMANNTNQTVPVTTLPNSAEGIPPEIMELLIGLLKVSVAVGVVLAAILLVGAGIGKMFRMKDVNDWITDIIKGLVTVLCATPLIFIIYYLATKLFAGSGWFVTPF